ncbi:MAG: PEP-CTERM sorting domain-containing protein, partial [Kiritimatiellaeota bacterium]|nr:PEP-CTERM sorting domain-containing protein [Kiritimatiellota bacterium]
FGVSGGLLNTTNFFRINYDALANGDPGGSMITLTAVPEPGTASLLGLIGVAFLVRRLRRRRAQS